MEKWAITRVETDELIMFYIGTFMDVMKFLNKNYEDGVVDVESYENWLDRQKKGKIYERIYKSLL